MTQTTDQDDQTARAGDTGSVSRGLQAALAYTVAAALPRVFSFLLLPLMTRVISPAEYGQLSLALAISAVVTMVFGFGLDVPVLRNYFQLSDTPELRDRYIGTMWLFLLVVPLGAAALLSIVATPFLASTSVLTSANFALAVFAGALASGATLVPYAVLRAAQRLRAYMVIGIGGAIVTSGSIVLAVVALGLGVTGWLFATLISNAVILALAMAVVPFRFFRGPYQRDLRNGLRLGLPMVPHYVSHWGLQLADRLVLAAIVSATSLGVYSLAANLAIPVMVIVSSLNQGFYPSYSKAGRADHGTGELSGVIVLQVSVVGFITTAGALLAAPTVDLVTPSDYHGAGPLAAWLVLGYGFLGLYGIPIAIASLTVGETRGIWRTTAVAAALNLAMVYVLVPRFGLTAAAVASAVGYSTLFVGVSWYAYRVGGRVSLSLRRLAAVLGGCVAVYAIASAATGTETSLDLILRGASLAFLGVALGLSFPEARQRLRRIPYLAQ